MSTNREAELEHALELAHLREVALFEQQRVAADILGIISSSPADLQLVLDGIVAAAGRLFDASMVLIQMPDDDRMINRAAFHRDIGVIAITDFPENRQSLPLVPGMITAAALKQRRTLWAAGGPDEVDRAFPAMAELRAGFGVAAMIAAPLLRADNGIGVLLLHTSNPAPFTTAQVTLFETLAEQAVIAIGNSNLFVELQDTNRQLADSLARQTATAEVLGIISRAPTDLAPVFEAVVERALLLSHSDIASLFRRQGDRLVLECIKGEQSHHLQLGATLPLNSRSTAFELAEVQHILDQLAPEELQLWPAEIQQGMIAVGMRTVVTVPVRQHGEVVALLLVTRHHVLAYTDAEIQTLQVFADQAGIAMRNWQLFGDLQQRNFELAVSLEQQTTTAEILATISRSPTHLQEVLDAIVRAAGRLFGAKRTSFQVPEGDGMLVRAIYVDDEGTLDLNKHPTEQRVLPRQGMASGLAVSEGHTVWVAGGAQAIDTAFPALAQSRRLWAWEAGSILATPMIRDDVAIAAMILERVDPAPFTPEQIALFETLADQAVIALENARLFSELQASRDQERELLLTVTAQAERLTDWNRDLAERVEQKVHEIEQLSRLRGFVSPQIAEMIVTGGEDTLRSHRRDITVLFSDLRGFTAFAETAEPEDVIGVLGQFHAAVGPLVFAHGGTLSQFAGDGMMVFFNDPLPVDRPALAAVRLGVSMRACAAELREQWQRLGYDLALGVGIASGYATCGRIGFDGRFEYTVMGTVVNLAARLCATAAGGQVLVTSRVLNAAQPEVSAVSIGHRDLKGLSRPVQTFDVQSA